MGYVKALRGGIWVDMFPESGRDKLMSEVNEERAAEYDPQHLDDTNWRKSEGSSYRQVRTKLF